MSGPERAVGGLSVRPPAGVELRPAARADLAAVLRLLAEREALPTPNIDGEQAATRWDRLLGSIDAQPFVAVAADGLVGLLFLFFRRRMNFATWEAWVPELVVDPTWRRRGVGRALLRVAIEEWRLRGAHRLCVEIASGEEAGQALSERLGLADTFGRFRQEPIAAGGRPAPAGVVIRDLGDGDAAATSRLVAEIGSHRSPVPERMEAVERSYREIIGRDADASVLAERGGQPVAVCTVELRETMRTERPEAWIPELVVDAPARGGGIGGALLDEALRRAGARGAGAAVLESAESRTAARALYRSRGFVDSGRVCTLVRDR